MDTIITDQSSSSSANHEINDESNKSIDVKSSNDNLNAPSDSSKETVETKDKSKFKKVESRYMQSTQQWVNKRNESGNQLANKSKGPDSRNASRNPTPERRMKKASTPRTNEKSLNYSGVSVINKVDDKLLQPELNKYKKPLMGRRSLAPRKLAFMGESSNQCATTVSRGAPMTAGLEENKKKQEASFMASIERSIYAQTLFLKLKAEQALKARREDAKNKISRIWHQSNKIREQILQVQENTQYLEDMIKAIEILEKNESELKDYLKIREQTDALFNNLAELIDSQKRLISIENCSEEDFKALDGLMSTDIPSGGLQAVDTSSQNIERAEQLWVEINNLEKKLDQSFKSFGECVKTLDKYQRIENQINEKNLKIKKLF